MGTSLNIAFCWCSNLHGHQSEYSLLLVTVPGHGYQSEYSLLLVLFGHRAVGMGTSLNIAFCWCSSTNLGTVPGHGYQSEYSLLLVL